MIVTLDRPPNSARRSRLAKLWLPALTSCVALCLPAFPQSPQTQIESQPAQTTPAAYIPAAPATYTIQPGDLLNIEVYGSPELSRPIRVNSSGDIRMPFGRTAIPVTGKTAEQVQGEVSSALEKDALAVDPLVEVSVIAVDSRPVVVLGAVKNAVTLQAVHPITLTEALSRAGGLADDAGDHILLTSPGPKGTTTRDLPVRSVLYGNDPRFNPLLTGGDEVRVLPAGRVYVAGAVREPGAFVLREGDPLTLVKALSLTKGYTSSASPNRAVLVRGIGPNRHEIPVNLSRVLNRKDPDLVMASNDVLYVPDSSTKKVTLSAIDHAAQALTLAAGWLIVR